MNPRVEYEMTTEDLGELLKACEPVPYIIIGGHAPHSQQENANMAWAKLGGKMGFDSMTVRMSNKGQRFFTAIPTETDMQRKQREIREAIAENEKKLTENENKKKHIAEEIIKIEAKLEKLRGDTNNG